MVSNVVMYVWFSVRECVRTMGTMAIITIAFSGETLEANVRDNVINPEEVKIYNYFISVLNSKGRVDYALNESM